MTQVSRNGRSAASTQELRAEVEHARDELADTVSQLAAKADVTARFRSRARETRARMQPGQGRHAAAPGGPGGPGGWSRGAAAATGAGILALAVLAVVLRRRHA
ncbi:DUF3618 domain-containing protein [Streptomyces sp. TR06-5]|uniref:DUF3618 domain-containing protein n=1 Tax=unclassified Streptomyces TaxID=2593676 RepID=UPI0039A00EBA